MILNLGLKKEQNTEAGAQLPVTFAGTGEFPNLLLLNGRPGRKLQAWGADSLSASAVLPNASFPLRFAFISRGQWMISRLSKLGPLQQVSASEHTHRCCRARSLPDDPLPLRFTDSQPRPCKFPPPLNHALRLSVHRSPLKSFQFSARVLENLISKAGCLQHPARVRTSQPNCA